MVSASAGDQVAVRSEDTSSRPRSIAMKLKALALCAALGGSTVALALPAQSAVQYNDPVPIHYYADATGNTDGYRSGSDNANIADATGNTDGYRSGSDSANNS